MPVTTEVPSDSELAQSAAAGNQAALESLLDRHTPTAVRAAFVVLGQREDAFDAAQEALMQIVGSIRIAWTGGSFQAWVSLTAHRVALNHLRRNVGRQRRECAVAADDEQRDRTMERDPLEKQEVLNALHEELANLPEPTASALLLHHLEGIPVADVAERMGLSTNACKLRLSRGREILYERLRLRGVTTASATVLFQIFDDSCGHARQAASTLSPSIFKLSLSATGAVAVTALRRGSDAASLMKPSSGVPTECTNGFLPEGASSTNAEVLPHETYYPLPDATSSKALTRTSKSIATCCGLIALLTACLWLTSRFSSHAQMPLAQKVETPESGTLERDKSVAARSVKSVSAETPKPAWQKPRFIDKYVPVSITSKGQHVAMLAYGPDLHLLLSSDGGQTWASDSRVNSVVHAEGSLCVNDRGNCNLLFKQGIPDEVWWASSDTNGKLTLADQLFGTSTSNWAYLNQKIIENENAVWAFAANYDKIEEKYITHVATARNGQCPKPLPMNWPKMVDTTPGKSLCWAKDADSAGFIINTRDYKSAPASPLSLAHYFTSDGGKTWLKSDVPMRSFDESTPDWLSIHEISIDRRENSLALLVCLENMHLQLKSYVCFSNDLGRTWRAGEFIGEMGTLQKFNTEYSIHFAGTQLLVVHQQGHGNVSLYPIKINIVDVLLWNSTDNGTSWMELPAIGGVSAELVGYASGGDSESVHIASHERGMCILRSFTPGEWKVDKNTPAWYKESQVHPDKLTQENF